MNSIFIGVQKKGFYGAYFEPEQLPKFPNVNSTSDSWSSFQSKTRINHVEEAYDTPFSYCSVGGTEARKITGVRQSGGEREPTYFEVMHDHAARILHGVVNYPKDALDCKVLELKEETEKTQGDEKELKKKLKKSRKGKEGVKEPEEKGEEQLTLEDIGLYFSEVVGFDHRGSFRPSDWPCIPVGSNSDGPPPF